VEAEVFEMKDREDSVAKRLCAICMSVLPLSTAVWTDHSRSLIAEENNNV